MVQLPIKMDIEIMTKRVEFIGTMKDSLTIKLPAIEQEKRDKNEVNSIYYENIVREKEGYPQRGYNYSTGD